MISPLVSFDFAEASEVLAEFSGNPANLLAVTLAGQRLTDCLREGGKIYSCGNGGSMCDAMHFAEELTGRFRENRRPIPALAISDPAYMSCVGNDFGFDSIFSRFIEAFGRKGDAILAISTSGNSPNILAAARMARSLDMTVIGLTGRDGGALAPLCDVEIRAPHAQYSDRAQEIHIKVIHALIHCIEEGWKE